MIESQVVTSRRQADTIAERFELDATVRVSVLRGDALLVYPLTAATATETTTIEPTTKE
jgi:hypothetical protein